MTKIKAAFYGVIVIAILLAGAKLYSYFNGMKVENQRLYSNLVGKEEEYKQLSATVAKLQVDYKSQQDLKDAAAKDFQAQIADLQGRIKVLSTSTFTQTTKERDAEESDVVSKDEGGYTLNEVRLDDGPPLGYVKTYANGKVDSDIYDNEISIVSAVSQDETTGKYTVLSKASLTLKEDPKVPGESQWVNKPFDLKVTAGTAEIDPTQPIVNTKHFYLLNPKVNLNLDLTTSNIDPGLGLSVMSYGYSKNDSDFKFIEVGFHMANDKFQPMIIPVLWRPFTGWFSNTYVGPGVYFTEPGESLLMSISVGL